MIGFIVEFNTGRISATRTWGQACTVEKTVCDHARPVAKMLIGSQHSIKHPYTTATVLATLRILLRSSASLLTTLTLVVWWDSLSTLETVLVYTLRILIVTSFFTYTTTREGVLGGVGEQSSSIVFKSSDGASDGPSSSTSLVEEGTIGTETAVMALICFREIWKMKIFLLVLIASS